MRFSTSSLIERKELLVQIKYIFLLLLVCCTVANARPVSYPGAWTAQTFNDGDRHVFNAHYSPTAYYAIGYNAEYIRDDKYQIHAIHMNNLLKRWNGEGSQANFYVQTGVGAAYSDEDEFDSHTELAAFMGISTDWETRRYFIQYQNRYLDAGNIADKFSQKLKAGIAPYVADYGSIHTWLMLELRHAPESEDQLVATPLVRLFSGPNLLEAGVSDDGDVQFNFVHRF